MRTIIDLPPDTLERLAARARRSGLSRAELIRRAVAAWLDASPDPERSVAFGIWGTRGGDGLSYEDRVRSEWQVHEGRHRYQRRC